MPSKFTLANTNDPAKTAALMAFAEEQNVYIVEPLCA